MTALWSQKWDDLQSGSIVSPEYGVDVRNCFRERSLSENKNYEKYSDFYGKKYYLDNIPFNKYDYLITKESSDNYDISGLHWQYPMGINLKPFQYHTLESFCKESGLDKNLIDWFDLTGVNKYSIIGEYNYAYYLKYLKEYARLIYPIFLESIQTPMFLSYQYKVKHIFVYKLKKIIGFYGTVEEYQNIVDSTGFSQFTAQSLQQIYNAINTNIVDFYYSGASVSSNYYGNRYDGAAFFLYKIIVQPEYSFGSLTATFNTKFYMCDQLGLNNDGSPTYTDIVATGTQIHHGNEIYTNFTEEQINGILKNPPTQGTESIINVNYMAKSIPGAIFNNFEASFTDYP